MFTRRSVLLGSGLAVAALSVGCSDAGNASPEALRGTTHLGDFPLDQAPEHDAAAAAGQRVAWQLLVAAPTDGNAVISPSSLSLMLAEVSEGAAGASAASLDKALGLTGDARSQAFAALRQHLSAYESLPESLSVDDPPEKPIVHQDTRTLVLGDVKVEQGFLDRLSEYYGAYVERTDHAHAKAALDAWARKNTAGLIKESAIQVKDSTQLVIQDALLFAAAWRTAFDRDDQPLDFTDATGAAKQLDNALFGNFLSLAHASDQRWSAVRLPYDETLAMDVVLPAQGVRPTELTAEDLEAAATGLASAKAAAVDVFLPQSDLASAFELLEPLAAQGIDLQDLGGMFDGAAAQQMAQQVVLRVGAKGTVGGALTEIAVETTAVQPGEAPPQFKVDRPYVLRVLDVDTGWPLFLAVVNDPTLKPSAA